MVEPIPGYLGKIELQGTFTCDVTPYYEQLNHWELTVKPATR